MPERGARLARRDDREYRKYLSEEQRSQTGCPARQVGKLIRARDTNMLISLRNVEKSYPIGVGRVYVLRRVNLDIREGEFVSIMGPSGAGKSTVLHILGMHDSAWSGEYYFMDQPVHRLNPKQRSELHKKHIGFVFQSYHLLDNLTVYENLEIPLSYRNVSRKDRQSMVDILD